MKNRFIKLSVLLTLMSAGAKTQSLYPSSVVQFNQGRTFNHKVIPAGRSNPQNALGVPQDVDIETGILNFVSLGYGGSIVLSMDNPITVTDETVVSIYETTYGFSCSNYPEKADVYLSEDGISYVLLGRTCVNDNTIMFPSGKIEKFQYIKVVDVSSKSGFAPQLESDAYDLDGIEVSNFGPLPIEIADMTLNYYQGRLQFSFATYSERNTRMFVLQNISKDRTYWEDVMEFEAAGESRDIRKYSQIVSFKPAASVSYFRLKEIELDGKITYHRMMAVQTLESGGSFKVMHDVLGREVLNPCPFAIYIK